MPSVTAITDRAGSTVTLGTATAYDVDFFAAGEQVFSQELSLVTQPDEAARVETRTPSPARRLFRVAPGTGNSYDGNTWRLNVLGLFKPASTRILTATLGAITLDIEIEIEEIHWTTGMPQTNAFGGLFVGTFVFADPAWRAVTPITVSSSPITVAAGNHEALGVWTVTPGGLSGTRHRFTVTNNLDRSLSDQLTYIPNLGGGSTTPTNVIVFYGGVPAPFYLRDDGDGWVRLNIPPSSSGESVELDVYTFAGLGNTTTSNDAFEDCGIILETSTATSIEYGQLNVGAYPNVPLAPQWAKLLPWPGDTASGTLTGGGVVGEYIGWEFNVKPPIFSPIDVNAIVWSLGVDTEGPITGLDSVGTYLQVYLEDSNTLDYVRASLSYMVEELFQWAFTTSGLLTVVADTPSLRDSWPASVLVNRTSQLAIIFHGGYGGGWSSFMPVAAQPIVVPLTGVPTVTVGSAVSAVMMDTELINSTTGDSILLGRVFMDAEDLTIDAIAQTIATEGGPLYTDSEGGGVVPAKASDYQGWLPLVPGANTITLGAGSWSVDYQPRYLA